MSYKPMLLLLELQLQLRRVEARGVRPRRKILGQFLDESSLG